MKSIATIYFQKARELLNKMVAFGCLATKYVVCTCGFDKSLRILTCFLHK